jgi:hypothetical protein
MNLDDGNVVTADKELEDSNMKWPLVNSFQTKIDK